MPIPKQFLQFLFSVPVLFVCSLAVAQEPDTAYNNKIKAYTTDPKFLPASVLNVATHPGIPSPLKYFGQIIGAPGVMHHTTEIYGYYKALADASPMLTVQQVGTTEEGRPIQLVVIANEATIPLLDGYKKVLSLLADPRKMIGRDEDNIISQAKPVYYLNGGLHSTEMGSPEMLMELAYRLITSNSSEIQKILDRTIIIINPVSEPDGRDKQVDWYYRYTKSRTEFEDGFRRSPPYWGQYVFHDNNRDGIQVSQAITNAIFNVYYDWHPTVMLDLHESVPLIYMSTGTGPYNETIDPITIGEWQIMANHDITALASQGLPGAFTWAFYDGWYPGYGIWVANNHNSIGRFYETFGNAGGNTYLRDLSRARYAGDPVTSREWYRPDPATPMVNWSSRDNINYMEAGVLASLSYAADNANVLLRNFYQKGVNSIRKGKEDKPRAFVIPAEQRDPGMAAYLVNQLRKQQIEVHQVDTGKHKNDYVVLLDQPYRNLAVTLLSKQNFSKDAKFPPYDDIAWTMGYLYGVDVKPEDSLSYDAANLTLIKNDVQYTGHVSGSGRNYVLRYTAQQKLLPALYWLQQNSKATVTILDTTAVIDGIKDTLAAGAVMFTGITNDQAGQLAAHFGLDLQRTGASSFPKQHRVTAPRVAIYHTWYNTQDEGWSRYTFEQLGIPYTSIQKDDLKKGNLRQRFDVILVPRTSGSASDFINGIDSRFGPLPYTKTKDFPSHGVPDATDDMTGGPGFAGMAQLQQFVTSGGVLIGLDNAAEILAEAGMAPGLEPHEASGLFHPGSVVNVKVRQTGSPVLYGFPEMFPIFRGNGPLLEVAKYDRNMMLLQYGTKPLKDEEEYKGPILGLPDAPKTADTAKKAPAKEPPYVLSGMVRNEQAIIGHGAIFNVPVGAGRVVAFTFDPLHRYLNLHDAPLVWNTIINWNHLQ